MRRWTDAQKRAIESKKKNLLVCAAAGSGKTAVLTERIIRYLTDPEQPGHASRLLCVTFSRAAAAELRTRIRAAVERALEEAPSDRLAAELLSLSGARISTIHSFCYDLIRSEHAALGLSPNIRLLDESETLELETRVIDEVIDSRILTSPERFARLTRSLVGTREQDALGDRLIRFYDRHLMNLPNGLSVLRQYADEARSAVGEDFLLSAPGKAISSSILRILHDFAAEYDALLPELPDDHPAKGKFLLDRQSLDRLENAFSNGYTAVRDAVFDFRFEPLSGGKSAKFTEYSEAVDALKYIRTKLRSFVGSPAKADSDSLLRTLFAQTPEQAEHSAAEQSDLLCELFETMELFSKRLDALKRRMEVCSFADLEQYAVRLLYTEDGSFSDAAHAVSSAFDRVFIDEYQDVNQSQKMIFDALSCECPVFRVGDVKQSIYAFRGADPSIIDRLRKDCDAGSDPDAEAVFMSHNFRSSKRILSFTNAVFEPYFRGGRFSYNDEDLLRYGPDAGLAPEEQKDASSEPPVRILLCRKGSPKEGTVTVSEASAVADEIERLTSGKKLENGAPIRYGDIAVLFRNYKSHAPAFAAELARRGIPVNAAADTVFFERDHILLLLSVLRTADNPLRDIPLGAVLSSPLFSFSPDDLLRVAQESGLNLWQKLRTAAEKSEKCAATVTEIESWRDAARRLPCDAAIRWLLVNRGITEMLCSTVTADTGRQVIAEDADFLYGMARTFAGNGNNSFSAFLKHLEKAQQNGMKRQGDTANKENAVRLMTIHASKGLEFPVCFVVRCGATRTSGEEESLCFCAGVGAGMLITDERGFVPLDSPTRLAVVYENALRDTGESERDLYVALTRARERLYLTAVPTKDTERDAYLASMLGNLHEPLGIDSYISAALRAACRLGNEVEVIAIDPVPEKAEISAPLPKDPVIPGPAYDADRAERLTDLLAGRLRFSYPDDFLSRIPAKLSVSSIYPGVLDEEAPARSATESETALLRHTDLPAFTEAPAFLLGESVPGAAEAGTATHQFLQFCDFSRALSSGAAAEADRLLAEGFLTERQRGCLHLKELDRFLCGDFCRRLTEADMLRREFRFNCFLPADRLTDDPALAEKLAGRELAVQGVIDGFFAEGNSIWLFDYKTDRLRPGIPAESFQRLLAERYRWQLSCYAAALRRIFSRPIAGALIYATALGEAFPVQADLLGG